MPVLIAPSPFSTFETRGGTYTADGSGRLQVSSQNDAQDLLSAGCVLKAALNMAGSLAQAGRRALLFGDSITAVNTFISNQPYPNNQFFYNQEGYFVWLNRLTDNLFYLDPALNKGVGGNTTSQMMARFQTDVMANLSNFDIAFFLGGINDIIAAQINQPVVAPSVVLANIKYFVLSLLNAGKAVVLQTIWPSQAFVGNTTYLEQAHWINNQIRSWVRTLSGPIFLVDPYRSLMDVTSTGGYVNAALYGPDGVHPCPGAAYFVGRLMAEQLSSAYPRASDFYPGPTDTYDALNNPSGNLLPNPAFINGGGGYAGNGTGTVANGWSFIKNGGNWSNSAITLSLEAQASGYKAIPGNKQVLTINIPSGNTNNESFQLSAGVPNVAVGSVICLQFEVDMSNLANLTQFEVCLGDSDGTHYPTNASNGGDFVTYAGQFYPDTYTGLVLRTPLYTVQAGTNIYALVKGTFDCSGATAGTATIKLGAPVMRIIS